MSAASANRKASVSMCMPVGIRVPASPRSGRLVDRAGPDALALRGPSGLRAYDPAMASSSYTVKNLEDVHDAGPHLDIGEWQEYRPAMADLHAERTGVALQFYKPGTRQGFAHRHKAEEELFVVLAGSGRVKLDDEIVELRPLDAIRVAPQVAHGLEGHDDSDRPARRAPRVRDVK
jgi:mannose-6-phosphate isomerase-like protein (cupin superfamily)